MKARSASPQLSGCFINLDRSPERSAWMQAQLERLGMGWVQRHPAVDATRLTQPASSPLLPAEYACYLSHLEALERSPPGAFHLVLEDDTELSEQLLETLARGIEGPFGEADVVWLECQPHFSLAHLSSLWGAACKHLEEQPVRRAKGVELLDARMFFKWSCAAYVVSPAGRDRMIGFLRQGLAEGPPLPVDRWCERGLVAGSIRGLLTVPFLATTGLQWHGRSDIGNGIRVPQDPLMVMRRVLFAGPLGAAEQMRGSFFEEPMDPALRMFGDVLREVAAVQRKEVRGELAGR